MRKPRAKDDSPPDLAPARPPLRFLTCGSVDDGKSTLIGRLLYDAGLVFDDQLAELSQAAGALGDKGEIDFAMLLDGLAAEREQGITIDVAYRYFATRRRRFIVADTPGHEQYTRNMVSGAATADLAVLLVDARLKALTQTRRHASIVSLLGIRHVVLAVNKIDLIGFDRQRFDEIDAEFRAFAENKGFESIVSIPLSARLGDNVARRSQVMTWYGGPTLLDHLETVDTAHHDGLDALRLPVQYVNRLPSGRREYCGTIAAGVVSVGEEVVVAQSGKTARVEAISVSGTPAPDAVRGQAVAIALSREIDVSRGSMLAARAARPHLADQFAANVVWFDDEALLPGRSYLLRTETAETNATVTALKHRIDHDSGAHIACRSLAMNDMGLCNLATQQQIAFDAYADNRSTGGFIMIDRMTNATVGAGMFLFPLRRAQNVQWQAFDVDGAARAAIKHQKPFVLWMTGLSGSGKSTISSLLESRLHAAGRHTYILDGDNVRHGLNRDLGFTAPDRVENIRRVAEVAKLMADAGLIVIVSFISPFEAERRLARELIPEGKFVEIYVDTPLEECIRRDPKGLYARALKGEIANFTGLDSPYEPPEHPDMRLATAGAAPHDLVSTLEEWLRRKGFL